MAWSVTGKKTVRKPRLTDDINAYVVYINNNANVAKINPIVIREFY